jgi:hypothetical protein
VDRHGEPTQPVERLPQAVTRLFGRRIRPQQGADLVARRALAICCRRDQQQSEMNVGVRLNSPRGRLEQAAAKGDSVHLIRLKAGAEPPR